MTTLTQVDYEYYEWLISQIEVPNNGRTYTELFDLMHNMEFVWTVPNDDNRVQDGLDLRNEFINGEKLELAMAGVTFLEVLIGLSRRAAFTAGGTPQRWAWKLIKNIRLNKNPDPLTPEQSQKVVECLEDVIWRTYKYNGVGGFFPLKNPNEDQTKVELWYQLNAYVNERYS